MEFKEPKVILLAETAVDHGGVLDLVTALGAPEWSTDAEGGEELIEVAGRLCYKSFAAGLNPNVTKVREGNREYLANILAQHHGSVLEHATATFALLNVSRVLTHELVRHRAGTAFSQESLRYVRLTDLGAYLPDYFDDADKDMMQQTFEMLEGVQRHLAHKHGLDDEAKFSVKKRLTSAFRRLAPIGLTTNIIITANHRAWRHIIEMRGNEHAEEEIQRVTMLIATVLKRRFPSIYQDMKRDMNGNIWFDNKKV